MLRQRECEERRWRDELRSHSGSSYSLSEVGPKREVSLHGRNGHASSSTTRLFGIPYNHMKDLRYRKDGSLADVSNHLIFNSKNGSHVR